MEKREKIEKINRIIAVLLMMLYAVSLLPAKEISSSLNASKQRLDYYLEKASAEYDEGLAGKKKLKPVLRKPLSIGKKKAYI